MAQDFQEDPAQEGPEDLVDLEDPEVLAVPVFPAAQEDPVDQDFQEDQDFPEDLMSCSKDEEN